MFTDAVKSYGRIIFNKNNMKWFHIFLLFLLHIGVLCLIQDLTWTIIWTLFWIIAVAPFSGWYIAVYKHKNNKNDEVSEKR